MKTFNGLNVPNVDVNEAKRPHEGTVTRHRLCYGTDACYCMDAQCIDCLFGSLNAKQFALWRKGPGKAICDEVEGVGNE